MTDTVTTTLIVSLSSVVTAGTAAYFSYRAKVVSETTHTLVNSRMTEFMEMAKRTFTAEGVLQEKTDATDRKAIMKEGASLERAEAAARNSKVI